MITVNVTQEDINNGRPLQAGHCPVALAATRAFGKRVKATAGGLHVTGEDGELQIYSYPPGVKEFIARFDTVLRPEEYRPFSFTVEE
jgi:hypothetical protein